METNLEVSKREKICFIITPIGAHDSGIRRKTDGLITSVIHPVLTSLNYDKIIAPHQMADPGSITNQVIQLLLEADMVIANLTGLNPNVMYELAIRHARRLPVVTLVEYGTTPPFDIALERTIFYVDDIAGAEQLKLDLAIAVRAAENTTHVDNPIYRVINEGILRANSNSTDFQGFVLDSLNQIREEVSRKKTTSRGAGIAFTSRNFTLYNYMMKIQSNNDPLESCDEMEKKIMKLLFEQNLSTIQSIKKTGSVFTISTVWLAPVDEKLIKEILNNQGMELIYVVKPRTEGGHPN